MYSFVKAIGGFTANVKFAGPPPAVSITVTVPIEAVEEMLNTARMVVGLDWTLLNVSPGHVVDRADAGPPHRLFPVIVTSMLLPRIPSATLTDVTDGGPGD